MSARRLSAVSGRKATAAILIALTTLMSAPAAFAAPPEPFTTKFFDLMKTVFVAGGEDPDQIEMARYYVYEPAHAEAIYSYVAKEDYVFIGILMAAKAARGQTIKGVGTFNLEACREPLTLFNAAFKASGDFMSKYGDDPHVKSLAESGNQKAKEEAEAAMEKYVPYWKDIPHICDFTFKTNFQREQDIRNNVKGDSRAIKNAYKDFSDGSFVNGVGDLISIGVNGHMACSIADKMVGGGVVGRTPVLGNLAKEACAGFAGAVIKGIGAAAGAVGGAVVSGASEVGDFLAGQSQHIPPDDYYSQHWAPHVAEAVANARAGTWTPYIKSLWNPCVTYFDKHKMSEKHARQTCDYQRDALFSPAVTATIELEDKISASKKEIDQKIRPWGHTFLAKRDDCEGSGDDPCMQEIADYYYQATDRAAKIKETNPLGGWNAVKSMLDTYPQLAADSIERSRQRSNAYNKALTEKAAPVWSQILVGYWSPQCKDQACVKGVQQLGQNILIGAKLMQMAKPDESSGRIQGQLSREYGVKFQAEVDASKQRAITSKAIPAWAELFLATWLPRCSDALCKVKIQALVDESAVDEQNLQRDHPEESSGRIQGMVNVKYGALFQKEITNSKWRTDPNASAEQKLAGHSCFPFPARPDEFVCKDSQGFAACVAFVEAGKMRMCRGSVSSPAGESKRRFASTSVLTAELTKAGCRSTGRGSAISFQCPTPAAKSACEEYRVGGVPMACHP